MSFAFGDSGPVVLDASHLLITAKNAAFPFSALSDSVIVLINAFRFSWSRRFSSSASLIEAVGNESLLAYGEHPVVDRLPLLPTSG